VYAWEVGKVEGNLGVVAESSSITELTTSARPALLVVGLLTILESLNQNRRTLTNIAPKPDAGRVPAPGA